MSRFHPELVYEGHKQRLSEHSDEDLEKIVHTWREKPRWKKVLAWINILDDTEIRFLASKEILEERRKPT